MFTKRLPRNGEKYFYIDENCDVVQSFWFNCLKDRQRLKNKNIFISYREAKLNTLSHFKNKNIKKL